MKITPPPKTDYLKTSYFLKMFFFLFLQVITVRRLISNHLMPISDKIRINSTGCLLFKNNVNRWLVYANVVNI